MSELSLEYLQTWLADIQKQISMYGERIAALEAAARPKPSEPEYVTGSSLDLDSPQYAAAFVECNECHAKPGTTVLCPSCLANRDKIYALRRALETANGLARQWKLNYDNKPVPSDRDQQAERASGLEKELGSVREQLRAMEEARDAAVERAVLVEQQRNALATLPEEMRGCVILFETCEKGHGWLHATNWVDRGCPTCRADVAERELGSVREQLRISKHLYWQTVKQREEWKANADTLERLKSHHERTEAERVALGVKVADLERRLERYENRTQQAAGDVLNEVGEALGHKEGDDIMYVAKAIRRDAERWQRLPETIREWALENFAKSDAASKTPPEPPKCPTCGSAMVESEHYWLCEPCRVSKRKKEAKT